MTRRRGLGLVRVMTRHCADADARASPTRQFRRSAKWQRRAAAALCLLTGGHELGPGYGHQHAKPRAVNLARAGAGIGPAQSCDR